MNVFDFQRDIYLALAEYIRAFSGGAGWSSLFAFLPAAVAFGAAHALTPGHSKTILATYIAASPLGVTRGLAISFALSLTHVSMAVLIALASLPLVSSSLGGAGRAPLMVDISRSLLALIGAWMLWRAIYRRRHTGHPPAEGLAVGFMAGLVPCPLTLFVMTFAIAKGVPQAGIAFALCMMIGVAFTLSVVAGATIFFRGALLRLVERKGFLLTQVSRMLEALAGLGLIGLAVIELRSG